MISLIIPFRQNYQENNNNKKIKYEYLARKEVLKYVLRKALNDYSDFESYNMPKVSKDMLEDFKRENDSVQSFIDDEFRSWKVERVPVELVYHAYTRYCEQNGFYAVSSNVFTRKAIYLLPEYKKTPSRITGDYINELKALSDNSNTSIRSDYKVDSFKTTIQCFLIK